MTGFKNFIMRGNLVQLAVAVVIGTQFSNLVQQFVKSFVNPLISLIGGTPDFGSLAFKIAADHAGHPATPSDHLSQRRPGPHDPEDPRGSTIVDRNHRNKKLIIHDT
jgi:hypothetical protein